MRYFIAILVAGLVSFSVSSDPVADQANKMIPGIKEWLYSPVVIDAVKAQNKHHASLSSQDIVSLDQQWRVETSANDHPLIDKLLGNALSNYLKNIAKQSNGGYKEIFVMDNKGLNVGQSTVTSDYWQGDEEKWQGTYLVGPDAVVIEDVEFDESTKAHQAQLSLPIVDPDTQELLGAVTVGVSVNTLLNQLAPQ